MVEDKSYHDIIKIDDVIEMASPPPPSHILILTLPSYGSTVLNRAARREDFPAPDRPQIPTFVPGSAVKETPL